MKNSIADIFILETLTKIIPTYAEGGTDAGNKQIEQTGYAYFAVYRHVFCYLQIVLIAEKRDNRVEIMQQILP